MWHNKGFQVLLSVYNAEKFIKRCFDSLNSALGDEDWILLIGNDASTDNTLLEIAEYIPQSSARNAYLFDYSKAPTVGAAKNKLIKEAQKFKKNYSAILMMDGDDEMTPERPEMWETATSEESKYVVGGWQRFKQEGVPEEYGWRAMSSKTPGASAASLQFGPWATLFHCDFLPNSGKFFPEDKINNCGYEDLLTWQNLRIFHDLTPTPHESNKPVHKYYVHTESVTNALDQRQVAFQRNTYWALLDMMREEKRDIFSVLPNQDEVNRAMAKYIMKKEHKNQRERSSNDPSLILPVHPLDKLDLFSKVFKK